MSLKEKIRAADDRPVRQVPCPEWGCTLWVRTLSARERDEFERKNMIRSDAGRSREANLRNLRARFVVLCATEGPDGPDAFTETDADWLGEKSAKVVDRLFSVAQELNGITDRDLEELAKNSSGPSGASPSGSPSPSAGPT